MIRRLTVDDAGRYRDLRLEALRDHPEAFASGYASTVQQPETYFAGLIERMAFFGAFADGELRGIVAFEQSDGDKDRHRGWMLQMYVQPWMRGTGCAMALVEALIEHAESHVLQVHLGVGANNVPAIRLYEKAGFETYGTDPRAFLVDGRFIDDQLMVRFLDKAPGKKTDNE